MLRSGIRLLQEHDALEQRLGPRRAAGTYDVDRDDLVDALGDRVRVPVGPPQLAHEPIEITYFGSGICS
jgi:hypothetical protein